MFKKALAYSIKKWDNKTMDSKESGWILDDIIENIMKKYMSDSLDRVIRVQMKTPQMKRAKVKR